MLKIIEGAERSKKITSFIYDKTGFLIQKIKPDGVSLFFTYDGFGNIITIQSSDSSINYALKYDAKSNLIEAYHKSKRLFIRSYDENDKLEIEELKTCTTKTKHDGLGRLQRLVLPNQTFVNYVYKGIHLFSSQRFDAQNNRRCRKI